MYVLCKYKPIFTDQLIQPLTYLKHLNYDHAYLKNIRNNNEDFGAKNEKQ